MQEKQPEEYLNELKNSRLFLGGMDEFKNQVTIVNWKIAQGWFGVVHSGVFKSKNNLPIAIKEYKTDTILDEILQQLKNLEKIDKSYPFIINCIGFFAWIEELLMSNVLTILIVFPLAKSDISKLILKENKQFTESEVEMMVEQVLCGLRFLKNHLGIMHRDIKPQNILVLESGTYCLADFGISYVMDRTQNTLRSSQRQQYVYSVQQGTIDYLAPEIVKLWSQ